jgi:hypothetical protein
MPRPAALVLVAALGAGLLLGGCSADGSTPEAGRTPGAGGSTASSPSTRETPSPVPTVEPAPSAPAPSPGKAGQKAFARHVMDLWAYALRTNDPTPLTSLRAGTKPCGGCAELARTLAARRDQGWTVDLPGLTVRRVTVARDGKLAVARSVVDVPETDSYNSDGTYRNTSPAHAGARFVVQMSYAKKRYRLVSFTVS